mgnify:CR=1 FL=1
MYTKALAGIMSIIVCLETMTLIPYLVKEYCKSSEAETKYLRMGIILGCILGAIFVKVQEFL